MNGLDHDAAEAARERRHHLGKAIGSPDQRERAAGFENPPTRMNPAFQRRLIRHVRSGTRRIRRRAVPLGIVERRIHQHDIGAVGRQAHGRKCVRGRRDVEHRHVGGNPVARSVVARKLGEYGRSLQAGELVMTGSLVRQFPLAPGDRARASFSGIGAVEVGGA